MNNLSAPSLEFAPYPALAVRLAERLALSRGPDALAPWNEEVIVASAGVADAVATEVVTRGGNGVFGLRLQSLETFAQRVVNAAGEYPRVATEEERRLAMRVAARAVDHPMLETRGAATMLERSYRDIRDSGITVTDFIARVTAAASLRSRDRIRVVTRVWVEYERLIKKLGAVDPADLLSRASLLIGAGIDLRPQVLAGFYDMTGAQLGVIKALQEVEKLTAVFVPVDPDEPRTYAYANTLTGHFTDSDLSPQPSVLKIKRPSWTINEQRTREDEIRTTCAAVAELLHKGEIASSIGIVARSLDPYDIHLFHRFASDAGFITTAPAMQPLVSHRIGRGLTTLLRLRDRDFPRGDVLELVRSGLRVKTRINVDKADVETRRASFAGGSSASLRDRVSHSLVLGDYVALVEELETITANIDARFLGRVPQLFRVEDQSDLMALDEIDAIATTFTRAQAWNRPFDLPAVIDALNEATIQCAQMGLGDLFTRRRGDAELGSVWLGDVMKFRGRSFKHLFVVRMQDSIVPQRRTEDPLLTDNDRQMLGIRSIGNGREEEQLLFQIIRGGATAGLHFSYASSDGFGKPLRASQYLKAFAIEQKPEQKQEVLKNFSKFASLVIQSREDGEGSPARNRSGIGELLAPSAPPRETVLRPLQLMSRAGTNSSFDGYINSPSVRARAAQTLQSVSPTQLEDFGECPQKFLLKHILRVRDHDDPEREVQINHREKGTLDHSILERFYRETTGDEIKAAAIDLPRLPVPLSDRLERIIDEQFDALEEKTPPWNRAMRAIERRATKRILRDFVAADLADLCENDLLPGRFEYKFGSKFKEKADHPEPFIIDIDGVKLKVEGMIDRVDEGPELFRIVDYKSGKALRHVDLGEKVDRGVRLQLALYAMAVADLFAVDPARVSGIIKPLVSNDASPDKFSFALDEKAAGLRETLAVFVRSILDGLFPAFPKDDSDFNACKYCPVSHSCRTRHDAQEKRAAIASGEPRTLLKEILS